MNCSRSTAPRWRTAALATCLAPLWLTACAEEEARVPAPQRDVAGPTHVFQCGPQRLPVRFEGRAAILYLGEGTLRLPQVISASGARFSDGTATFWTKGETAEATGPGMPGSACHLLPREAVSQSR